MATDEVDQMVDTDRSAAIAGQDTKPANDRLITSGGTRDPAGVSMRRPFFSLFRCLMAFALLVPVSMISAGSVAASVAAAPTAHTQVVTSHTIATTTTCGDSLGAATGGRGLICDTTIANTVTTTGGSAVVTVHECYGSAGSPIDGTGPGGFVCNDTTTSLTSPVTTVDQCNYSITGAGNVIRCSVVVTTNFTGVSPGATPTSLWQCDGSGASGVVGVNIHCNPFPATTSGAAITQCNGSANGGTLVTPEGLTCVATGTMSSALPVTINQCNNSANGGGEVVNCSATVTNNVVTPRSSSTAPPTSTASGSSSSNNSTPLFGLMIVLALGGLGLAAVMTQRRSFRI
jgi:hypothetical protein